MTLLFLRTSFTSFTADMFTNITDTFAFIRFRQAIATDFGSKFADMFVIDTGNYNLSSARAFNRNAFRSIEFEGMGEAESQGKFLAFHLCSVTNTNDFQFFFKAFRYAFYHIGNESTG